MNDQVPVTGQLIQSEVERPKRSATLGKIGLALAKAQGQIENAEKDTKGNFGKYATLASTWDAIRKHLSANELAIYQRILTVNGKPTMCTMLLHSSGEFIDDGELELIYDRTGGRITPMQAMGSAITYARRYTLQAATGVAPADDDDGANSGKPKIEPSGPPPQVKQNPPAAAPKVDPKKAQPKAPPNNFAPASQKMIDRINELCIDKQIPETILNYLIVNGYGESPTTVKHWQALEIGELLSNEDTNEATIMAQAQKIGSKRAANEILKKENK